MKKLITFAFLLLVLAGCGEKYEFPYTSEKEKIELVLAVKSGDEEANEKIKNILSELEILSHKNDVKAREEDKIWENISLLLITRQNEKLGDKEAKENLEILRNSNFKEDKFYKKLNKELDKLEN